MQLLIDIQRQLLDIQTKQIRMDDKQTQMDRQLQKLVESGVTAATSVERPEKGRDRRRLKERLKRASNKGFYGTHRPGWIEHIFGICPGDQRMGTEGSRFCPQPTLALSFPNH